ncbi:MAG: RNA polymerase sigma factor [Planctomycetota bacterium]|jgi:RNA polymerase sigma-70 factor (ECF subfamily)
MAATLLEKPLRRPQIDGLTYEPLFAPAPQPPVRPSIPEDSPAIDLQPIIAGCIRGDADSFAELLDIYADRCYGYFYRLTADPDLSDELLSRLFLRLVRKINSYNGGIFDCWLFRIASNIFHDHLRKKKRQKKLLNTRRTILESKSSEPKKSDAESIDKLQTQLKKLDADSREVIILRFYSQLTLREIATLRNEPTGTVSSRLHRGLNRLKQLMT